MKFIRKQKQAHTKSSFSHRDYIRSHAGIIKFHAKAQRAQSIRRCRSYVPSGWKLRAQRCSLCVLCISACEKHVSVKFVSFVGDTEHRVMGINSMVTDAIPNFRPIGSDERCCSSLSAEVSPTDYNRHIFSLLMATLHL